jgi:serine protease AprX
MNGRKRFWIIAGILFFLQSGADLKPQTDPSVKLSAELRSALGQIRNPAERLRVWVYFRDKGVRGEAQLQQSLAETRQALRARSQWRRSKARPETNLVDFEDIALHTPYTDQVRPLVFRIRAVSRWLNALSVEAAPDQVWALSALDCVTSLDLVHSYRRSGETAGSSPGVPSAGQSGSSSDPIYGGSFDQLQQISVIPLHQQGLSGHGVLVCLLDVGFHTSHEVFRMANLVAQWDFVFGDGNVERNLADRNDYSDSHGTATWSLLGGFRFGQLVGVAFGADFILGKTEDDRSETPIEEDYWVAGIEWAESLGAEVVSSSLGYTDWYQFRDMDGRTAVTTKAANRATSLGVVVVNAAGNERRNAWGHIIAPADGYEVVAVGAVDSLNRIASFSSPGPTFDGRIKPEVCALGVGNWIADTEDDGTEIYSRGSGTSFATPLVGGVAALLLEAHPGWTPRLIRDALMTTANNASSPNNDYGWGVVNAAAAASRPGPALIWKRKIR